MIGAASKTSLLKANDGEHVMELIAMPHVCPWMLPCPMASPGGRTGKLLLFFFKYTNKLLDVFGID